MKTDENCIFCKIVKGEVPSAQVYEDDSTFAFLSIGPNNQGHTLVIPKDHATAIYDLQEETLLPLMRTIQRMAKAVKSAMGADGINLHMNNDAPAGQAVFHAHIHIIPRFKGDGLEHWPGKKYAEGEAEAVAEKIKTVIG